MKKKRMLIIIAWILIISIFLISAGIYINYKIQQKKEKEMVEEIKSHYSKIVEIQKDTKIYEKKNDKYKVYGEVSKNVIFNLEKVKINNSSQKYFKVQNENYYVYYDSVKKNKQNIVPETINSKFLIFNKNIKTDKLTKLIKDNKYLTINKSMEFPLQYMDDNSYYVNYLNNIWKIEKNDTININEYENTQEIEADYVSIILYKGTNKEKLNEKLQYLRDNEFYTITLSEYKEWLKGNVRLKEKAVLLTLDNENNDISNTVNNNGYNIELTKSTEIKFNNNNSKTTLESKMENLSRYVADDATNIGTFKKMISGETVIIKKEAITKSLPNINSSATQIAVLNYHFFYDPSLGESCNEHICLNVKKFREQLQYLKDNNYKTLTIEEFRAWMYGEIELPARSVLLTVDDGAMGTGKHNGNKLIPLLEEYNMHATLFLITGWWDKSNYISPNLDVQSHTHDMHKNNCDKGPQMLCYDKETVINDLKQSISILGSDTSFCFPFYAYNDSAIESVKEVGFKISFIGGNVKATRNSNKFKIPRYPIYSSTTLSQFINMIN